MTLDATLAAIDTLTTACAQCNGPRGGSPSDDFCSEMCQRRWMRTRSTLADRLPPATRIHRGERSVHLAITADISRFVVAMERIRAALPPPARGDAARIARAREEIQSAFQFHRIVERSLPALGVMAQQFAAQLRDVSTHLVVFDEPYGETPQQRALRLQRERNTGPRRERYAKRGQV